MSTTQSAISQSRTGFHTVRGGIDPGNLRYRSEVVGFGTVYNNIWFGCRTLPSPGAAGPLRWPEGKLSPHVGSMSLSQSAICQCRTGFHTVRGGIDPDEVYFRLWAVGFVEIRKDF